jgi:hypothetical protein
MNRKYKFCFGLGTGSGLGTFSNTVVRWFLGKFKFGSPNA